MGLDRYRVWRVRILHVNPFFFPYAGGIERRILGLAKELQRKGHDLHVLTGQLPGTPLAEVYQGIPVTRLPSKTYNVYNPPYIRSTGVAEAIRRIAPDVIDFHYRWAPTYTKGVRAAAGSVPVVFTFHNTFAEGSGFWGMISWLNDTRFKRFLAKCHTVVCVSEYVRHQLLEAGMPADNIRLVYNGIDPTPDEELARLRRAVSPDEPPYCVFVGRIVRIKGLDVLIEAASKTDSQVRFKIIGRGPQLEKLQALAAKRGVAKRFDFLGYLDEAKKREWIAGACAMTHPARFEASAVILYEALNLGCPVISTQTGGTPEIVGEAGVLVPLDDPQALAAATDRVMSDEDGRRRMAADARERSRMFAWSAIGAQMERIYESAAASSRPARRRGSVLAPGVEPG